MDRATAGWSIEPKDEEGKKIEPVSCGLYLGALFVFLDNRKAPK